jgi:hypothetical protein
MSSPTDSNEKSPLEAARNIVAALRFAIETLGVKLPFELNWITESTKDVADKLKEYRNFIHPAKELRYGVTLGLNDSSMFWQVTKVLTRQLFLSA